MTTLASLGSQTRAQAGHEKRPSQLPNLRVLKEISGSGNAMRIMHFAVN